MQDTTLYEEFVAAVFALKQARDEDGYTDEEASLKQEKAIKRLYDAKSRLVKSDDRYRKISALTIRYLLGTE